MRLRSIVSAVALGVTLLPGAARLAAQAGVPQSFPGTGAPKPAGPAENKPAPATSAPPAASQAPAPAGTSNGSASVDPGLAGAPLFPSADLLESFDAGRGQRYYLFGTNVSYLEVVAYYKKTLNNGGRELFKTPAMQQFDLGKFQDQTMAYPPSVVVKDYAAGGSAGYLHVIGTQEKRYATIIQIVPR